MKRNLELEQAIQQCIGFTHAKNGFNAVELATSMNMTREEFKQIKEEGALSILDIEDIANFFGWEQ